MHTTVNKIKFDHSGLNGMTIQGKLNMQKFERASFLRHTDKCTVWITLQRKCLHYFIRFLLSARNHINYTATQMNKAENF